MNRPSEAEVQAIELEVLSDRSLPSLSPTKTFNAYFAHYNEVFCPSNFSDAVTLIEKPVLNNHTTVLQCLRILKNNPCFTRHEFLRQIGEFAEHDATEEEKWWAAKCIVSATFMVSCGSKSEWKEDQSWADFLEQTFGSEIAQSQREEAKAREAVSQKRSLKAWKLVKRNKIKIRPTNNLLDHLRYNPKDRVLHVFHQTKFLQAQLKRSKCLDMELGFKQSAKLGMLPPRLLLETLMTIHYILFPLVSRGNKKSIKLLRKLIKNESFDPEATWVEFVRPIPDNFPFTYWGSRLAALHSVVESRPPTNAFVSWFQRHASERNALTVATVALFLAVVFGLLSTVLGCLQLIVGWLAWKYPVT